MFDPCGFLSIFLMKIDGKDDTSHNNIGSLAVRDEENHHLTHQVKNKRRRLNTFY